MYMEPVNLQCACSKIFRNPLPKSGCRTAWFLQPGRHSRTACREFLRAIRHHFPLGIGSKGSAVRCCFYNSKDPDSLSPLVLSAFGLQDDRGYPIAPRETLY